MRTLRVFALLALLLLTACSLPGGQSTPSIAAPTEVSPLPAATLSPTPASPLAILVLPADMDQAQSDLYQTTVYNLALEAGYRFQVRNTLSTADLDAGLKAVIALAPDPGLATLSAAAPQTQFLGVGIAGLTPGPNLSLIGAAGDRPDLQAFMAGYIAAMLAEDYRVGIITQDTPGGAAALQAFTNGMRYYCGLCNPAFPPWYEYPLHPEIASDIPESQYPAYAQPLLNYQVEVAYVYPEVATPDLLDYMAQSGLKIIGEEMPFEDLRPNWAASIQPNVIPAIQSLWPDLLAGKGGADLPTPLFLAEVNPDLFSEGKQRLAEEVLADLLAGYMDTGVKP